jgi:hypothetical protein
VELTPAQQEVLGLLRDGDRPEVEPELRHELRRRLERELAPVAQGLTAPVFVSKAALARVLACETRHVAEAAAPFEWSIASARGTVAHKAVQLSVARQDRPAPLRLVDDALERLADDPQARIADWLLGLTDAERADLRSDVNDVVAGFLELWPPLQHAWRPQAESRRRAELAGGMVQLTGTVDLTLGAPNGLQAGRVVVDLKTGARHGGHADDLRFYALLDTLRVGVPPFRLVSYYLDSGTLQAEDVTEDVLEVGLRRTIAATTRIVELHLGMRSPTLSPNVSCRWCLLKDTCDGAAAWEGEEDPG